MRLTPERAVLLLIAVATALRLGLAAITDLGLDEAYALVMSRHWQLSYFDHPPLTFWIARLVQMFVGPEPAAVLLRLPFIALAAGTAWLLFRVTAQFFGGPAGAWAVLLFLAAPFFLLSAGSWVVPDGPLSFFLALAALALSRIIWGNAARTHWRNWLIAGVAIGMALLSKYHAALFATGAAVYFLLAPVLRRAWLGRPQPYAAALVALALFSPVLIWNAQNEWASFVFQLGRQVTADVVFMVRQTAFEVAYLLPTTAVVLVVALFWGLRHREALFFLALGLPAILVLDGARFAGAAGFPHWAMPGWMFVMPVAGVMIAAWRWRLVLAGATLTQAAVVVAAVVLLLSAWRIDAPGLDEFRLESASWRDLPAAMQSAGRTDEFVVTDNWRDGTRIAEALPGVPVAVLDADLRGFAWLPQPTEGSDVLIVSRLGETALADRYAPYFERLEPVGNYDVQAGNASTVRIARGVGFRETAPYGSLP
jgi:4-amino-4-deoxy-L-arabinose transferase-like glycosyltransferase